MKTYYLIRFIYDKEYRKDTPNAYFKPVIKQIFIDGSTFNSACAKLLKEYENARKFRDITKPRKIKAIKKEKS